MKRKILLTGGTGFVGSFLAHRLLKEGYEIIFLARAHKHQSAQDRIDQALGFIDPSFPFQNRYEVIEGDVTKPNLGIKLADIQKIKGQIDEMWHLAASISFRKEDADKTYKINVDGTKNVLEFISKMEITRFHYFSTAYVCGNRKGTIYENELDCSQKQHNSYEKTKFEVEQIIEDRQKNNNLAATIYRPSIIVGGLKTGKTANFFGYYEFVKCLYDLHKKRGTRKGIPTNQKTRIVCSKNARINIVSIDFVIGAVLKVLSKEKESIGKRFHIVNQNAPQFEWLFETANKILGIRGFKLIDTNNQFIVSLLNSKNPILSSLKRLILNKSELEVLNTCSKYLPYMLYEPDFDDSNLKSIAGNYVHPQITENLLKTLLEYVFSVDCSDIKNTIKTNN